MWMGTMVIGSMVYAAQMHLQSIGRSDRDKFLKERLSPEKLAAAAFQRSGMSSILPMLADQGAYLAGYHPLFDTRSTGSASQGFISNPSLGFVDSFAKAIRGGAGVASKGSPWSQSDERAAFSLLPGGNLLPFVWMNNALIRGLPEKG